MVAKGFTLIELLIVVAIIGILAVVGVPIYSDYISSSKTKANDLQTTYQMIGNLANDQASSQPQLPAGVEICPDSGCNGPYTVYSSDPCQNPYKGGHNKKLAKYFMNIRCLAKPNGVSCNSPHAVRKSWKGRVLKYGDRGPMQCN